MRYTRMLIAVSVVLGVAMPGSVGAQAPAPAPAPAPEQPTIWSFLGIPQAKKKCKDKHANKDGCSPQEERTDPVKRIADPENLQSPSKAVQLAAKIKQDQDAIPQKIKALKYLGSIGCGCYPGVKEALVDALTDCSEIIRYHAAIALCQAAGNPCKRCENAGCCNALVMNKLQDMAYGTDDKGCPKEPSPEVRAAAAAALASCKKMHPAGPPPGPSPTPAPGPGPTPEEKPLPITPRPIDKPSGEVPLPIPPRGTTPIPPPPEKPAEKRLIKPVDDMFETPSDSSGEHSEPMTRNPQVPGSQTRLRLTVDPANYERPVASARQANVTESSRGTVRITLTVPERTDSKPQQ